MIWFRRRGKVPAIEPSPLPNLVPPRSPDLDAACEQIAQIVKQATEKVEEINARLRAHLDEREKKGEHA